MSTAPSDARICERLKELAASIGAKAGTGDWSEFYMRIPADPDHDADIIMGEAAKRLAAVVAERDALKAKVESIADCWHQTLLENYELEPLGGKIRRLYDTPHEYADAVLREELA